jgi:hypothetical protein
MRYKDYVDVFNKGRAHTHAPHRPIDPAIDLEPAFNLPHGRIYNLLEFELRSLKANIETNLPNGFIQRSSSPAAAPNLFAKKKHGVLQLCVDKATVSNRYPLQLISEMIDRLRGAQSETKLDLRNPYHLIRIQEGDK